MRARPPLLTTRWLALGAGGGAACALALEQFGLAGPWQKIALLLVLLAMFAISAWLYATHERERDLSATSEQARHGQELIERLQHEIDHHTRLEHELTQAKQAAESAVLAKGEFLATMSHEIRTPLNGIVPMLDLLLQGQLTASQLEMVRTAYSSSQQLLRIVDDILDYSKLEADRLELETTNFNLRELLENVIRLMDRPAESKGLRLYLHLDGGVRLPVRGDPVRLRQVLTNLISNAVKFTEKGSVSVHVHRQGETATQHQLRFEVRDTGIGIPAEAMDRLFSAFSQADASTTRLYGGTGLGLAICKRIVELMGGRIGVKSEIGRGTDFWFEIPLLKVHGDLPARDASHSGMRVMLLSSDPRLRMRLSMLLPNWGMRLTAVETTQEALDRLRAAATQGPPWAYAVVVADLAGMRNTAIALRRNLEHQAIYGQIRLLCLAGEEAAPEELRERATILGRQAQDADLRAALVAEPQSVAAREVAAESEPEPIAPRSEQRRMRVLLVEDNPVNLMVGQRLLGVLGTDCDTAGNGEEAMLRMSAARYDLVLMDCQMPVMDGYTATRRWREMERDAGDGRHLPIIAMTANAMAGDRQKCLDAGMDDYLAKPVTRAELERSLHRWWHAGTAPATPAAREQAPDPMAAPIAATPVAAAAVAIPPASPTPQPATPAAPVVVPIAMPVAAEAAPLPAATIDDEVLAELRAVLGGELDRLIRVFLDDAPRHIAALEEAALAPDLEALREHAHSLKSASANLGAMQLSTAAKRVELGARTGTLDRPAVEVAKIAWEFKRARDVLLDALPRAEA
jgi:signal transduction histidine kinase/DNA-binding response OmpR family regulator/HPt (histidine-containing phosphotransfer) domain-containing protein